MTYQQLVFKHTFMFMQNSGKTNESTGHVGSNTCFYAITMNLILEKISIACKGSKNNIDSKTNKIVKNNDITKYLRYIKSRKRKAKESKNLEQYLIRNSNRAAIVSTECQIMLGKKGKQYKE
uniref:Uncharacterized protein n=1 Tax=Glossina pallidipes TaxID=7398 RepID=A0A1A9Z4C1_GLOPL